MDHENAAIDGIFADFDGIYVGKKNDLIKKELKYLPQDF